MPFTMLSFDYLIFILLRLCCWILFLVERVCMAFDLLPALRPRQWRATICVGVCCKWEYRGGTDGGPIQHVDLVLLDEKVCPGDYYNWPLTKGYNRLCKYLHAYCYTCFQGNIIYGEIPGNEVEAKSPLLQEDGIYVIHG